MSGCPVTAMTTNVSRALEVTRRGTMRIDRTMHQVADGWNRRMGRGGPDSIEQARRGAELVAAVPPGAVSRALSDASAGEATIAGIRGNLTDAQWSALGHRRVPEPVLDVVPEGRVARIGHALRGIAHDLRAEFGHRPDPSILGDSAAGELRGRVRDGLQGMFAPLAEDMLTQLRSLRDVPLDELPMAGTAPVRAAYEHGGQGERMMRSNVGRTAGNVTHVAEHLRSEQRIEGAPRMRELDVVVPIGEHGEAMARALSDAARVMDAVALDQLTPHTQAIDGVHGQMLGDWTFRRDTMPTLLEGNGSFAGMAGVFTHRKVDGLDGDALLARIDEDHLFDRAAKGPLGLAGPMFFHGILPTESVTLAGGRLKTSAQYDALDQGTRSRRKLGHIWPSQVRATQRGCPIALKPPAATADASAGAGAIERRTHIAQLGHEYITLARRFYARELERSAELVV